MLTYSTHLRIINDTFTNITKTIVTGVDRNDWNSKAGPHVNFQNQFIVAKSSLEKPAEISVFAKNCMFTMTLQFSNGTIDCFRINQKYAIGKSEADFHYIRRCHDIHYRRQGENTLVITINNTIQQLQEHEGKKLITDAKIQLQQKNYEQAIKRFDQGFETVISVFFKEEIKNHQFDAYYSYGKFLIQEALNLEAQNKTEEAELKLNDAIMKLQQARTIKNDVEVQNSLKVCALKLEGNRIWNEALKKEKVAYDIFNKAKDDEAYNQAQNKYREALIYYEEALMKFKAGEKIESRLAGSVMITRAKIVKVKKIVRKIELFNLKSSVQNMEIIVKGKENMSVTKTVKIWNYKSIGDEIRNNKIVSAVLQFFIFYLLFEFCKLYFGTTTK